MKEEYLKLHLVEEFNDVYYSGKQNRKAFQKLRKEFINEENSNGFHYLNEFESNYYLFLLLEQIRCNIKEVDYYNIYETSVLKQTHQLRDYGYFSYDDFINDMDQNNVRKQMIEDDLLIIFPAEKEAVRERKHG